MFSIYLCIYNAYLFFFLVPFFFYFSTNRIIIEDTFFYLHPSTDIGRAKISNIKYINFLYIFNFTYF